MAKAKDVVVTIPPLIPRRLLSLVLRIDVCFTKQHDKKKGQGSGYILALDPVQGPRLSDQLRKLMVEAVGSYLPPCVFVTCRHVVDYSYQHRQEYGWHLSRFVVRCFNEGGSQFPPADFPLEDICVLVPKNEKLDMALIAAKTTSAGYKPIMSTAKKTGKLSALDVADIVRALPLCDTMPWGAEVGFTSIQPWTNGYPILRSGRVSGDPKVNFQSPDIDKDDIYFLEAQSFAGSSGAPVVSYPIGHPLFDSMSITYGSGVRHDFEKYRRPHLVGIMSGHISNDRHESGELHKLHVGLSYCHKAAALHRVLFEEELKQLWPKPIL